jgi:oligoribonuclease
MLLFGDFETTGLDPDRDAPLEFGMILVQDDLALIDSRTYTMRYPRDEIEAMRRACTFEQHEKSGLWDELLAAADGAAEGLGRLICDPVDFDDRLCAVAARHFGGQQPELAGFGPHFDQRYLRRYAPRFLELLSHRLRDVRTLAQEVKSKYPTEWGPKAWGNHRAMADCTAALEYLRWFRLHVMMPYGCRPLAAKPDGRGGVS